MVQAVLGPIVLSLQKSQSEGTIQLVPEPRKMAIIIPRHQRGTWEGVTVTTWYSEWICRIWGGLGPHTLISPASLSLPPMRGAVIGRVPTILQNDSFYTRISNFVQSPILSAASTRNKNPFWTFFARVSRTTRCCPFYIMYEDYTHPLYNLTSLPPEMTWLNTWHYPVYYSALQLMTVHPPHSTWSFFCGNLPLWRLILLVTSESVTVDLSRLMSLYTNDLPPIVAC